MSNTSTSKMRKPIQIRLENSHNTGAFHFLTIKRMLFAVCHEHSSSSIPQQTVSSEKTDGFKLESSVCWLIKLETQRVMCKLCPQAEPAALFKDTFFPQTLLLVSSADNFHFQQYKTSLSDFFSLLFSFLSLLFFLLSKPKTKKKEIIIPFSFVIYFYFLLSLFFIIKCYLIKSD